MYDDIREENLVDDYLTQSKARQEELKGLIVALHYDIDPELVLEKGLARILSKLPSLD